MAKFFVLSLQFLDGFNEVGIEVMREGKHLDCFPFANECLVVADWHSLRDPLRENVLDILGDEASPGA